MNYLIKRAVRIIKKEGIRSFIGKTFIFFKNRLRNLIFPYALLKIKIINQNYDLNKCLHFVYNDLCGIIKPSQKRTEISELLNILEVTKPKVILEIGTANGGTLFLFAHIAQRNATLISIDLPGGKFGGGYPKFRELLYKKFIINKQQIYLLRLDSHANETLNKIKNIIGNECIDFLFIDGDHTFEGIKKDFDMYSPLLRKGGIIACHDIVPGPFNVVGEVPKFWNEIKNFYNSKEIVENWNQNGYGIGIITK